MLKILCGVISITLCTELHGAIAHTVCSITPAILPGEIKLLHNFQLPKSLRVHSNDLAVKH